MHKEKHCKEVMRKIKQQWGCFTDEDISRIQESFEERERGIIRKIKTRVDELRKNH